MKEFLVRGSQQLRKNWRGLLGLFSALIIRVISSHPEWIEARYTYGLYPLISGLQRLLFGWIPFSIGDLFYASLIFLALRKLIRIITALVKRRTNRASWINGVKQILFFCLFVYVSFNLLWGLNYNRSGIAKQLHLEMKAYTLQELDTLTGILQQRLNAYSLLAAGNQRDSFYQKNNLFKETSRAYEDASVTYPFLHYSPASIKPSMFSYAGNILGFQGYYNPFSGEAQVNTTVPVFTQPFIACHEVGHQVGYGKENEANFAGFLACRMHPSPSFKYSVYFDMYHYAINELYERDSVTARHYLDSLRPDVKKDFREVREFFDRYENPLEPVITWLYGKYLKANRQPAGRQTYNQVVAFLIAYQKKFGRDSL